MLVGPSRKSFVGKVHTALPDTPVLYLSIKPSVARWHLIDKIREANRLVEQYAAASAGKIVYVDVFTPLLTPLSKSSRTLPA